MFLHTKGRKDLRRKLNSIWDTLSLNSLGNIQVEWPNGLENIYGKPQVNIGR